MLLILPLLFLSQSSSLLTSMQSSSEVPSAAELVSAIEKLVKTKMVSVFAGLCIHNCGPEQSHSWWTHLHGKLLILPLFSIVKVKLKTFDLKRPLRNLPLASVIFLCWWIFVFVLVCIIRMRVWVHLSDFLFISEIKIFTKLVYTKTQE